MSDKTDCRFAQQAKNSYKAKPYLFKKRTPIAGAYPSNYSPYRLASQHALNTAVKLAPAEVFSDCKLLRQGILQEFPSKYFEEPEAGYHDMEDSIKTYCKPPTTNYSQRRVSSSRYYNQREFSSQGLPVPLSVAEERRQLRAALQASVSSMKCSPCTPKTVEPIRIKEAAGHIVPRERPHGPVQPGLKRATRRDS
jgi:hypothetical protein